MDLFRPTLRGDPERSCDAIAMVLVEQHNQLINADESFYNSDESRAMVVSSLSLCPKPWNPASIWLLYFTGRSEDEATCQRRFSLGRFRRFVLYAFAGA